MEMVVSIVEVLQLQVLELQNRVKHVQSDQNRRVGCWKHQIGRMDYPTDHRTRCSTVGRPPSRRDSCLGRCSRCIRLFGQRVHVSDQWRRESVERFGCIMEELPCDLSEH